MKIGVFSTPGGHLTEILRIAEAFAGHSVFFVLDKSPRHVGPQYVEYQLETAPWSVSRIVSLFWRTWKILRKERPDVLVSTGAEIAIPAYWFSRLLGVKTIFIESATRIDQATITGRLLYPVTDCFLVQHREMLKCYGRKARYEGSVL